MSDLRQPAFHRRSLLYLSAAFVFAAAKLYAQSPAPSSEFIAFRGDPERVVATVLVPSVEGPQVREGLSPPRVARFGYEYFEPPDYWGKLSNDHNVGDRWLVHTSPGRVFEATVERRVGGYFGGCTEAIGILLRVAPEQARAFGAVRPRYFVATPAPAEPNAAAGSGVRTLPSSTITPDVRRSIESILDATLAREFPGIRSKDAQGLTTHARTAQSRSVRAWARERLQIDDAMERGESKLRYDVQAFQLAPDRVPVLFVRAEWLVGGRQGFAASLWLRGSEPIEVLETNIGPATWLRGSLFRGGVAPSHMGLILNVLDRDGDGWGEVLLSWEGYESRSISLLEYSPEGFQRAAITLSGGC